MATKQLKADGLPVSVDEEQLKVFFQNKRRQGGGPVQTIELIKSDTDSHSCIITFKESEAVDIILKRGDTVVILDKEVKVTPINVSATEEKSTKKDRNAQKLQSDSKLLKSEPQTHAVFNDEDNSSVGSKKKVKGKKQKDSEMEEKELAESLAAAKMEEGEPEDVCDSPEESTIKAKVIDVSKTKDFYILYFEDPNVSQGEFDEDSIMLDGLNKYLYVTFKNRKAAQATCHFKHQRNDSNFSKVEMATGADFDIYSNLISVHGYSVDSQFKKKALADFIRSQSNLEVLNVIQEDELRSAIIAFDPDECDDICSVLWQCASTFNGVHLITAPVFRCLTVSVKGLKSSTTDLVLQRYLSNKRSGGGEVECVKRLNGTEAHVTFKEQDSYDGVLEKTEHKLEDSKLTITPYHPCLSKKIYEDCIDHNKNIPSLLDIGVNKQRSYPPRPGPQPNRNGLQKPFYLSTVFDTFHNKPQACFELTKHGQVYLKKHPETLDTTVKQASCIWKLFYKMPRNFLGLQVDGQGHTADFEEKEILVRAVDVVRPLLDTITVLEFRPEEKHIPGFQQMCSNRKGDADFEVYVHCSDKTVVFISKLPPHRIQKIMNDMYQRLMKHPLDPEPEGAFSNQNQRKSGAFQGQQKWNAERRRGRGRGGFREGVRGRFRRGSEGQEEKTEFQGFRTQQRKPSSSLSDETGVRSGRNDRQSQEKGMKQSNTGNEVEANGGKEGKKYNVVKDMELQTNELKLLQITKYHKDIEKEYSQLIIVLDFKKSQVLFKGNDSADVESARFKLYKKISANFKSFKIKDFSKDQMDLLSQDQVKKRIYDQMRSKNFHAHLQCSDGNATFFLLFYAEPTDASRVTELVKSHVQKHEEPIVPDMLPIFKSDRGHKFLEKLSSSSSVQGSSYLKLQDKSLLIIGSADQLSFLQKEVAKFTEENKPCTEEVLCSSQKQAFISRFQKPMLEDITKSLIPYGTTINQRPDRFIIKGPRDAMEQAQEKLTEICSQVCIAKMKLKLFGIQEYLSEKDGKSLLTKVEESQSCILSPDKLLSAIPPNMRRIANSFLPKSANDDTYMNLMKDLKPAQSKPMTDSSDQPGFKGGKCNVLFIVGDVTALSNLDAIVNTVDTSFRLNSALSQALVAKGGPSIQRELEKISASRPLLKVIETSAGQMSNCRKIIHMACPVFGKRYTELQDFGQGITECLRFCEKQGYRSIAISPSVIGRLFKFPRTETCQVLMRSVLMHLQDGNSTLSTITFCDMNADNLSELQQQYGNTSASHKASDSGFPRKMATSGTIKKMKIGNVILTVKQGDITDEKCDAIVSSVNSNMDLSSCGAVCKALYCKCGSVLQDECNQKRNEMIKNGIVLTSAPSLPCRNILHVSICKFSDDWTEGYVRIFEEAENLKFTSLAIPPFGAGQGGASVLNIFKKILVALQRFASFAPTKLLDVRLVVFTQESFEKLVPESKGASASVHQMKPKPVVPPKPKPAPPPPFPPLVTNVSEEVVLTVYTSSKQKFEQVKKEVEKEFKNSFKREEHEDMRLTKLNTNQIRELQETGLKQRIHVTVRLEEGVIIMQGFGIENIYQVVLKLKQLLVDAVEGHHISLHLASKSAIQWQFLEGSRWRDFEPLLNIEVEKEFNVSKNICVVKDGNGLDHHIDFMNMIQHVGVEEMKIRRKDRTADGEPLPEKWDHMHTSENLKLVTVEPVSSEFLDVQQRFQRTFRDGNFRIRKIERVQNKALYQQYKVKKREMDQRNPRGHRNERRLYHGTDAGTVKAISSNGFSRNYSGKNATAHGEGVYFAKSSSYSHRFAGVDSQGNRMMFQSRVLVGESIPSQSGMKFLPNKPGTNIPYDSGICAEKGIFIIFHDAQAYPEYIITYSALNATGFFAPKRVI